VRRERDTMNIARGVRLLSLSLGVTSLPVGLCSGAAAFVWQYPASPCSYLEPRSSIVRLPTAVELAALSARGRRRLALRMRLRLALERRAALTRLAHDIAVKADTERLLHDSGRDAEECGTSGARRMTV